MAFNTILKTVKIKKYILHQCIYLYSSYCCRWVFRGDRNCRSNFWRGKSNTEIAGNYKNYAKVRKSVLFGLQFWSMCVLPKFCSTLQIVSPPGNPEEDRGACSHFCVLLSLQLNPTCTVSCIAVLLCPTTRSSLPRLVPLVPSTAGVAMRMNTKSHLRKSQ